MNGEDRFGLFGYGRFDQISVKVSCLRLYIYKYRHGTRHEYCISGCDKRHRCRYDLVPFLYACRKKCEMHRPGTTRKPDGVVHAKIPRETPLEFLDFFSCG